MPRRLACGHHPSAGWQNINYIQMVQEGLQQTGTGRPYVRTGICRATELSTVIDAPHTHGDPSRNKYFTSTQNFTTAEAVSIMRSRSYGNKKKETPENMGERHMEVLSK